MAGVFKLDITETVDELKTLLSQQKTAFGKERVQALYLLKLNKVKTIQELAHSLGRDRTTLQRWGSDMQVVVRLKPLLALHCSHE